MGPRCWRALTLSVVVAIVGSSAPVLAGSISLAWDPVPGANGYRVYYGPASGQYTQSSDRGNVTQTVINGLADCTTWYLAVKAYNVIGESPGFSNEVIGWARPQVTSLTPSARKQGEQFTLTVTGTNFQSGASLEVANPNVFLASTTVLDCSHVQAAVTIEPTAAGVRPAEVGLFDVTVVNPDNVFGLRANGFEVQIEPARFDLMNQPGPSQGRLDGRDTIEVSTMFGGREGDALYHPDGDFNGDGWIDGQDLAYLAGNLGKCWTGSAWAVAACPAGLQ